MTTDAPTPPSGTSLVPDSPVPSSSGTTRDASDGRVALRLRNRQRVIDALVALVDEGEITPSMESIVERSGVSERSIFRYFTDLADLSVSAIRTVVERAAPLHVIADIGEGSLAHRIDETIAARLRVAKVTHSFGTLARRKLALTPEIQQTLTNVIVSQRQQFADQFATEFATMTDEEVTMVTDVLLTMFSYEGLDVVWHQLGNDHDAVAARWRLTMTALLSPSA